MKNLTALTLAVVAFTFASIGHADENPAVGKWKAEFDSQIGTQKYTFEFKIEEGKLAGKAIGVRDMGTNEVKLVDTKLEKDEISFVEPLKLQDNEIRIEY